MNNILLLTPVFTHNIWGGTRLKEEFGYKVEGNDIGECWGIAAHPNGDTTVSNGVYKGMKLSEVWKLHPELFGKENTLEEVFPLLIKIIDARDDLSIQVHPNDEYARMNENGSLGKMECWYILDCEEDSKLVIGHNAKSKKELIRMIEENRWNEWIREIPVKKGDFIQINPGTVHAIKGGIMLLETQQNSDITYRVYDYDRLSEGKPRELRINKSIDVITTPMEPVENCVKTNLELKVNCLNELYNCDCYIVFEVSVNGGFVDSMPAPYMLASVVDGEGIVNGQAVKKGSHFILTAECDKIEMSGQMKLICSVVNL